MAGAVPYLALYGGSQCQVHGKTYRGFLKKWREGRKEVGTLENTREQGEEGKKKGKIYKSGISKLVLPNS